MDWSFSSEKPWAATHCLPNSTGEYHNAPIAKTARADTTTGRACTHCSMATSSSQDADGSADNQTFFAVTIQKTHRPTQIAMVRVTLTNAARVAARYIGTPTRYRRVISWIVSSRTPLL